MESIATIANQRSSVREVLAFASAPKEKLLEAEAAAANAAGFSA